MTIFLLSWFSVMFALVFSPGPANVLLMVSGASQGFKKSLRVVAGIDLIFLLQSIALGYGLFEVLQKNPKLAFYIQLLGILYLFKIAWGFLPRNDERDVLAENNIGFKRAALMQVLNAKGWALVILMFSLFLSPAQELWGENATIVLLLMLAGLNVSIHIGWALVGAFLGQLFHSNQSKAMLSYAFFIILSITGFWMLVDLLVSHRF